MVQQVTFPACRMHGNRRHERSGQSSVSALEKKKTSPFTDSGGPFSQLLPAGGGRAVPVPGAAEQPRSSSARPWGWQRPGRGYPGTPCFPQRCLSRQLPLQPQILAPGPKPPGTSLRAPAARWHRRGSAAESAPGPTLPGLSPIPARAFPLPGSCYRHRERQSGSRMLQSSGTRQGSLGCSLGSPRGLETSQVLRGLRDGCSGSGDCAEVGWSRTRVLCWCWGAALSPTPLQGLQLLPKGSSDLCSL